MGKRIVEQSIKKMKAPEQGNWIEWDSEIPGFGVRVTANGVKSFILAYRIFGRQRRFTIGQHPEVTATAARIRAGELRGKIRDGHDPMEERNQSRTEPTLDDLAQDYLERWAVPKKREKSVIDDRRMLDKIILPRLGRNARVKAIGKRDIEKLHTSLKETPYQANRVRSLLSKMFNLAIEWKWITENPAKGITKHEEEKREYWMSVEKIQRFCEALDSYGSQVAKTENGEKRNAEKRNAACALKLLLLTGSRAGEVLKSEWGEFDLQRGRWTKPSDNTKQKKVEHVPLSAPTLDLLKSMMLTDHPTGPLFPGRNGGSRVSLKRPWVQACKAAGLVEVEDIQGKRGTLKRYKPTVRVHDLRHSYASHLVNSGVPLMTVSKLLGHAQLQTTLRYAHLEDRTLRAGNDVFAGIYIDAAKRKTGT